MLDRRSLLIASGSLTAATALGVANPAAALPGDRLVPSATDWRQRVLGAYFGDGERSAMVRPLQGTLELWELDPSGFMIVDSRTYAVLEYSPTTSSPFARVAGELCYLGPGGYFADGKASSVNVLTGHREP